MSKRKLTTAQKAEKRRRKEMYKMVFMNGKQVRVRREQEIIDPTTMDDITLHQLGMWDVIEEKQARSNDAEDGLYPTIRTAESTVQTKEKDMGIDGFADDDIPF